MPRRTRQLPDGGTAGEIGVHDPFELVRHLARSQGDPRKAIAELVQNALDEQATKVTIARFKDGGESVLSVLDDGRGVLPELPRAEALTAIARNIGHSRKRQLSFDERMRQAMLGQYGIGLLGFWSVGHELRMVSRVADSEVWALTLFEDSPRFTVQRMPDDLGRPGTWTEVQVRRLHRAAQGPTAGGRLANYLSVELRGQLLRHGTELSFFDRLARGSAEKRLVIKPMALAGERLPGLEPLRLAGFEYPVELLLQYAGDAGAEAGRVRLCAAGAVVLDDLALLPELARAPWSDPRLVGLVDFPHLEVPPGSRRGVVPNAALAALVEALNALEPRIAEKLEERSRADAANISADLHRQLARLFTRVTDYVPHLQWFPVARRSPGAAQGLEPGTALAEATPGGEPTASEEEEAEAQAGLFPPGPLAAVRLRPAQLFLAEGESRPVRALAFDAEERRLNEGVEYAFSAEGPLSLSAEGAVATITALAGTGAGRLSVRASQGDRTVEASAPVELGSERRPSHPAAGIPQPEELDEPLQSWRSRLVEERWQVNVGHPDYRALAGEARPRLRYLASLLSKEVISRNFPQPGIGGILEELVGLLAALERSGAWSPGGRVGGKAE